MGFPKDPTKFPIEFAALYRRALKENFEIDLGDRNMAISYVHRLHAYRRAIEEANAPGAGNLRSTIIRQRGTRIIFENTNTAMEAIRSAVGMEAPSDAELDAYLAQLEQGTDDDESIRSSDSREQSIYSQEEEKETKVETDYLRLFQTEENKSNEN